MEPSLTTPFFDPADSPYIASCLNLSVTATSVQQQWPLKQVLNCPNNLSTTASFFWQLMKKSRMVMKFDLYDTLMIGNGTLIVFHSYCCSKIIFILPTILIVEKLHTLKNHLHYLCILITCIINNEWITIMGYSKHELSTLSMLYSRQKFVILHLYLAIMATSSLRPLSSVPKVTFVERSIHEKIISLMKIRPQNSQTWKFDITPVDPVSDFTSKWPMLHLIVLNVFLLFIGEESTVR